MTATLVLRRAAVSRNSGSWSDDDYDVFDADCCIDRMYRLNAATEAWWWGVSFMLTGRKSYGHAESLDQAKAVFKAEYEKWKRGA
jgi:hypothetical protein